MDANSKGGQKKPHKPEAPARDALLPSLASFLHDIA
jgi:hypothetical protein